jgi:adenine-specific DNA-methyltransferase
VTDQPDQLDLRSHDIADDRRQELLRLFPEVRTEGGKLDFERLKLALGETVDVGKERYGMTWPGKADCFKTIQMPSLGTLRPCPEESVNFDTTENLIIEGDNLEVLKLLQKSYLGKVKMVYIDPPYNTGNDFIYPDNYTESLQTYLEFTGQVDAQGKKFSTNTEADGRFHSKWLNMMYPRLFLGKNLLREDGALFVSCDDNEVHNLRELSNEIFGEENFIAQLTWEGAGKNDARQIGISHEYVVVYARNRAALPRNWTIAKTGVERVLKEAERLREIHHSDWETASTALATWFRHNKATPSFALRRFRFIDKNGVYKEDDPTAPGGRKFDLINPRTGKVLPLRRNRGWAFDQEEFNKLIEEGRVTFVTDESVMVRRYLHETDRMTPQSVFYQPARSASERLNRLMNANVFEFPKDETVIAQFLEMTASDPNALVLDFFAGSGTSAHAVLDLNKQDGSNRKFILVQLPEPCAPDSAAYKAGFKTIADICKERVRRVIKKLNDQEAQAPPQLALAHPPRPNPLLEGEGAIKDRGFRVFKLAESNFTPWDAEAAKDAESLAKQLELHIHHIRDGRTEQDLLFELLLKSGFPLTTPIKPLTLEGKQVHGIANGAMLICLERELTLELIRAMADQKPERVVCLDEGFAGHDQLKANAVQIFKTKGVTSFKTV